MKNILICFILISFVALLSAQQQSNPNQLAIQQKVIGFFDALSNRDSVSLNNHCTSDILLFENGEVWNLDTLIKYAIALNTSADFKRKNTFEFINTAIHKNIAWVSYDLYSEITRNGKQISIHWMETVILIKEKRKWKIKLLHSTLISRN